ncbi:MAG TPA: glycosyltransferase [Tabrizicola sp.]|nr:glycosyltransferase [Tabrizicola sp.]
MTSPVPQLRALQVIDHLEIGGAQRLLEVFQTGATDGAKTEILSMGSMDDPLFQPLSQSGVVIHVEPDCRLWRPSSYLRLARDVRRIKPDVLHLHLTYATIIGAVAGWLAGCPVVASIHNTHTVVGGGMRGKILYFLEGMAIRLFVDRLIFVGSAASETNQHRFGSVPMVTIDNVVEPADPRLAARRDELRASLNAGPDDIVVLSTARLHPAKNIGNLLQAFATVHRHHPRARLWICGAGPLAGDLADQAAALKLGDTVSFLGGRDDVAALLQAADIFALSSDIEGLPLALLEAMAAGLPVVATAVGSVPDYVDGDVGLLVPPRQVEELTAALLAMVGDAALRQRAGRAARNRAHAFTDVVQWRKALEAEYTKALQKRGA